MQGGLPIVVYLVKFDSENLSYSRPGPKRAVEL